MLRLHITNPLFLFLFAWSIVGFAKESENLSTDERLYELEAKVATLSAELQSTKELAAQEKPNAFNPSISVVGDLVGQYGFNLKEHHHDAGHNHGHDHGFVNGVHVREVELELRGEVDPFADALVAIGFLPHGFDHLDVHLEEAYARLKQWPGLGYAPLGMIIKGGMFKTAIGRINRVHRHNIPQMDYPLATKAFLGDHGYSAPGLSINAAFNPAATTAINVFVEGAFNSRVPLQDKGAEKVPNGILHLWLHQELAAEHFLDIGATTLVGRKGQPNSGAFWMLSGDLHYSYLPLGYGQNPLFLFGSELYAANKKKDTDLWSTGFFSWAQVKLFGPSFFGVLYDLAPKIDSLHSQHAIGAYLSYYTTEFLRFRLGYEHIMPKLKSFDGDHRLMLSAMFVLGSHPVEPYFVNR